MTAILYTFPKKTKLQEIQEYRERLIMEADDGAEDVAVEICDLAIKQLQSQ